MGKGGREIDLADHLIGDRSFLNLTRPSCDEGNPMTTFVDVTLDPSEFPRTPLIEFTESLKGMSFRTVIRRENDEGIIGKAVFFKGF